MTNTQQTLKLTEKEQKALLICLEEGINCNGAETAEDMLQDNMTWFGIDDLMNKGNLSRFEAAGIMGALQSKGLADEYEPKHKAGWVLTDTGVIAGFNLKNGVGV